MCELLLLMFKYYYC